jgi:phosphoribosylformimino-5-aminoimidazole carboxamide ribotide isomerase
MLLIPAMDLVAGRCVRLYQGDFAAETRYELEPAALYERYRQLGASWLHVVDLDGAREGRGMNRELILALSGRGALQLQVGGGVRSTEDIADLIEHGVARVVIGSIAVTDPPRVCEWLDRFGCERVCLAFDVRHEGGEPLVRTHGWRSASALDLWQAVEPFRAHGLRHVLCTDIERDGALAGPNLALYRSALERCPELAWQASGGVRDAGDLEALAALGMPAAVSGKALLEERISHEELRPFLPNASFPASTCATVRS